MAHHEETKPVTLWHGNSEAGTVEQVEAYPRINDSYWVPTRGCMLTKGYQLFDTYGEAKNEAKAVVVRRIAQQQKILARLEKL